MVEQTQAENPLEALVESMIASCNGQVGAMLRAARDEALAEAKALIKARMVQAILQRAAGELDAMPAQSPPAQAAAPAPAPADSPAHPPAESRAPAEGSAAAIRQEVEAIRKKLAENEQRLRQVKPAAPAAGKAQPAPADEIPAPPAAPAPAEAADECAYYVYGIVAHDEAHPVAGLPQEGIDPAYPVATLPYRDVEAIFSRVSLAQFDQDVLKENLRDIAWLAARVTAHQCTLEAAMAGRSLVPMRLCTIYRSEAGLREMLAQHHDEFTQALCELDGRQEWGIKVYMDDAKLAERVKQSSSKAREAQAAIDKRSGGAAYFAKKQLETLLGEEAERLRDEAAQRCHDRLAGHAADAAVLALQDRETTGREADMVLNGAYLVADADLAGFTAEALGLNQEYADVGFNVELSGPWPAYNFVSIDDEGGDLHAS